MTTAFVTGPTGCIGAATVQYLLDHGIQRVVGMSRKRDFSRIAASYHDRLEFIEGDITSLAQVQEAISSVAPNLIIHLAAFQTPDCMARPLQGGSERDRYSEYYSGSQSVRQYVTAVGFSFQFCSVRTARNLPGRNGDYRRPLPTSQSLRILEDL